MDNMDNPGKPGKMDRIKETLLRLRTDLFLLSGAAVCFSLFLGFSVRYRADSDVKSPLAQFESGMAERRRAGDSKFQALAPKTPLFNLDTLWVGPDKNAVLALRDGTRVRVNARTLIVLKRPFNGGPLTHDKLKVISGSATVQKNEREQIQLEAAPTSQEIPNAKKADEKPSAGTGKCSPEHQALLVVRKGASTEVDFTWPDPVTGFLVISGNSKGEIAYYSIRNARSASATVRPDAAHYWQVVDENRKVLYGPFKFELRQMDREGIRKILADPVHANPSGKRTQVLWR